MCGIVGYIGDKRAQPILLNSLKKLEYRGYDSAGIAILEKGNFLISKCKGKISTLENIMKKYNNKGSIGIGHSRWATHGEPSKKNAHPHTDCFEKIAIVHNGIIENHDELRKELKRKGCKFKSQTDTEVIAHLISKFKKKDIKKAIIKTIKKLKGSFALGILDIENPDKIFAAKRNSSLVIGVGEKENFIASDVPAILHHTKKVIYLKDNELAEIEKNKIEIFNLQNTKVSYNFDTISYSIDSVKKNGYKHFMLKEIYEQPKVCSALIDKHISSGYKVNFKKLNLTEKFIKNIKNIVIIACGTAYHAGLIGKYFIEAISNVSVDVDVSSEFRYRNPIIKNNTLVIAISQSGETADTLAAVKKIKEKKIKILSICNTLGSSLTRCSDANIYTHAGPEIGVASTKTYIAQLMILYFFGLYLNQLKNNNLSFTKNIISDIKKIPEKQIQILKNTLNIKKISKKYLNFGAFLYLGRNINFPSALEGALKLKEISYIPAEGYAAGEMKHGPIALIDEYRAVVCIANDSFIYDKMISNIREILARRGNIIAICTQSNKAIKKLISEVIYIPKTKEVISPLLVILPLQLIAYYVADLKGFDVDKPRNLAKSVTVE